MGSKFWSVNCTYWSYRAGDSTGSCAHSSGIWAKDPSSLPTNSSGQHIVLEPHPPSRPPSGRWGPASGPSTGITSIWVDRCENFDLLTIFVIKLDRFRIIKQVTSLLFLCLIVLYSYSPIWKLKQRTKLERTVYLSKRKIGVPRCLNFVIL